MELLLPGVLRAGGGTLSVGRGGIFGSSARDENGLLVAVAVAKPALPAENADRIRNELAAGCRHAPRLL